MKSPIEGARTYRLFLDIGFHLDLVDTLYVPSIARDLFSMSKLCISRVDVKFGFGNFSLYKNSSLIGSGFLIDDLYRLKLDNVLLNLYLCASY